MCAGYNNIFEDDVRKVFGFRTYEKGRKYFEEGLVFNGIVFENKLIANVQGTMPRPYKVIVSLQTPFNNRCSCPLGGDCKHVVATLLSWIHNPDLFLDGNLILEKLDTLSDKDLRDIFRQLIKKKPSILKTLAKIIKTKHTVKSVSDEKIRSIEQFIDSDGLVELSYRDTKKPLIERLEYILELCNLLIKNNRLSDAIRIALKTASSFSKISEGYIEDYIFDEYYNLRNKFYELISKHITQELFDKEETLTDLLIEITLDTYEDYFYDLLLDLTTPNNYKRIIEKIDIISSKLISNSKYMLSPKSFEDDCFYLKVEILAKNTNEQYVTNFLQKNKPESIEEYITLAGMLIARKYYNITYEFIKYALQNIDTLIQKSPSTLPSLLRIIEMLSYEGYIPDKSLTLKAIFATIEYFKRSYYADFNEIVYSINHILELLNLRQQFLNDLKNNDKVYLPGIIWFTLVDDKNLDIALDLAIKHVDDEIPSRLLKKLIVKIYENNMLDERVIPLIKKLANECELISNGLYISDYTTDKLWQSILQNAFSIMSEKDIDDIVKTIIEKIKDKYYRSWENYLKKLYFMIPKYKDILYNISLEIIPHVDGELMGEIGSKMEQLDIMLAVKQYLHWIHTHITRSHVYYTNAVDFLKRVKTLLLTSNNVNEWVKVKNEIINRYHTRKKFMKKLTGVI
ncbi:MAG: SWIM zinc finger family protein [Candidatus Asgardarchaeia archaeon]